MRILVVDDHEFQRSITTRMLRNLGETSIVEARDGAEALAMARAERPSLVFSDLNMPGMDGMAFIRQLAQEHLADSLVILSGLAPSVLRAVRAVAVASGLRVLGVVSKPMGKETLASLLHLHQHSDDIAGPQVIDGPSVERAVAMGQFKAWFSPVLDLTSLEVVSVEVTARWESAEHGVRMGAAALTAVDALDVAPVVARQVIEGALAGGALWRQLDWHGTIVMPLSRGAVRDERLLDWLAERAAVTGMVGSGLAVSFEAASFALGPTDASYAVARAMLHGYPVTVHVRTAADLDALGLLAACNLVTCPAAWIASAPSLLERMRLLADRVQADIGVSELTDAQVLGVLGELGVRFAQGPVIGVPATAAETYDLHLTAR